MRAATAVLLAVSPLNLALNIFLVHHTSLGILGSPIAISITYWTAFFLLCVVTAFLPTHRHNKTWGGFKPSVVFDLYSCITFIKLAVPGILMVGTEWLVYNDFYRDFQQL